MRRLAAFTPSPVPASIAWSLFAGVYTCFVLVLLLTFGFTTFVLLDSGSQFFALLSSLFLPATVLWWLFIERSSQYTYAHNLMWSVATVSATFWIQIIRTLIWLAEPGGSILDGAKTLLIGLAIWGVPAFVGGLIIGILAGFPFMYIRRTFSNSPSPPR